MTTRTAPLHPRAVRVAREQARLTQRELGRRVAARMGEEDAIRALQVRLSRIENGDGVTEADRELVDALAAELALGRDDLGVPPYYVWFRTREPSFVSLGLRLLLYSTPEAAFDSRDALAHASHGEVKPMQDALLHPLHQQAITDILEANFGTDVSELERKMLVAVDPDADVIRKLVLLQIALETNDVALETVAEIAVDEPMHLLELTYLHSLALRRLQHARKGAMGLASVSPERLAAFEQDEARLIEVLSRAHQLRLERRDQVVREDSL